MIYLLRYLCLLLFDWRKTIPWFNKPSFFFFTEKFCCSHIMLQISQICLIRIKIFKWLKLGSLNILSTKLLMTISVAICASQSTVQNNVQIVLILSSVSRQFWIKTQWARAFESPRSWTSCTVYVWFVIVKIIMKSKELINLIKKLSSDGFAGTSCQIFN